MDQKSAQNRLLKKNSENSNDFLSESVPIVKIDLVVNFLQRIKVRPYFGRLQPWPNKNCRLARLICNQGEPT